MALSIVHNAGTAVANRLLDANNDTVTRSVAKLSAGSRVLSARDDAAALAIGSRLRAEIASLAQASVNAGQAASILQIADGASAQIDKLLVRMKTLAVQAGSDQLSNTERAVLDSEFQALGDEVDRIAKTTDFNGVSLLEGDVDNGVVFTIRSDVAKGTVQKDGRDLRLGDSFTQADLIAGRVTYANDGTATGSDELVVSVSNASGFTIGTLAGEGDKATFETAEYFASTALDNIAASAAYARGATGAGVTVAVVDTGIDIDHPDFQTNLNAAVDIRDTTVEGLRDSIAGGTFTSGGGGEITDVRLFDVDAGIDFFERGLVPTLNVTGANAAAATVTLTIEGVDYTATANLVSGGPPATALVTLTETGGTRQIDIGLTTTMLAGAVTSTGPVLVNVSTPTTGDGNDDNLGPDAGHGTQVAGFVAAERNGDGVHGVAFDSRLLAINVGQDGGGLNFNDVADAIDYARANGADVINLSLGSDGFVSHTALETAIARAVNAGIIIVASTGNSALNDPAFPANFAIDADAKGLLIAVAATDDDNALASFSNKAGLIQDFTVTAPGVAVVSTTNDGGTGAGNGTSFSAPLVAGAAALLRQHFSELSGEEIASLLFTTATDLGAPGNDTTFGRGIIDLDKATAPLLNLSINIDDTSTVAGAFNVATESTVALDRALLDYTLAYEGRVEVADRSLTYKVGTGTAASDKLTIGIGAITANALGVDSLRIDTAAGADTANETISAALDHLVSVRAAIGAAQNRLAIAINNLEVAAGSTESARSQLLDLDVADGISRFTSQQILSQLNISVLAQANQQSQALLRLFT